MNRSSGIRVARIGVSGACFLLASVFAFSGRAGDVPAGPHFIASGKWDYSTLPGHEELKSTVYTNDPGAEAAWIPAFEGPVRARVAMYKMVRPGNDPRVRVEVRHGGSTREIFLDTASGTAGWADLGVFEFLGEPGEGVRLTRVANLGTTRAGAVRFDVLGEGEHPAVIQTFVIDDLVLDESQRARGEPDVVLPPGHSVPDGPPEPERWELTFEDTFGGDRLDPAVWDIESGSPGHILSSRWPENILVSGGLLRFLTRKERRGNARWTTGSIWTKTFRQQYGYFEARMRVNGASGLNNAFWLMSENKPGEPGRFEIDIVEAHSPNRLHLTMHDWSAEHWAKSKVAMVSEDLSRNFHVYALEWNEREIVWFFDGIEVFRIPNAVCHGPSPIRLSTAVGRFAGRISDALDGTSMDVDWVRAYRRRAP